MIFEVTAEQIEHLNDTDLRTLVGFLCEEEVRLQGHSPISVTRGGNQNASDEGIDVRVSIHDNAAIAGYIPASVTGFQVKAQDMPWQPILTKMAPGGVLGSSIANMSRSIWTWRSLQRSSINSWRSLALGAPACRGLCRWPHRLGASSS